MEEDAYSVFNVEERFKNMKVSIPIIDAKSKMGKKHLKDWLGYVTRNIFSHGFNLFEKGDLNEQRVKIFCCENIIYNIFELVKKNNLDEN